MNALDLYKHWETFCHLMEDPEFDAQTKHKMGYEMISSLPPDMLCAVSKSSREAIELAMVGRLTNIGIDNGRSTSKEEEPTPSSSSEDKARDKRPSKKPLRKDAANGRGA